MSNIDDPYKILGVSPNASDDEIKKAYRELSRKYHPDANSGNPLADLAEEKFKEVQTAYSRIMDMRSGKSADGYSRGTQGYSQETQNYGQGYNQNYNRQRYEQYGSGYGIIWTIAQQVIYAVIFGVQIHFVNVWEEICAVAFKVKTGCMVWSYYGDSCDFTDLCRSYRDKFIFSACTGLFSSRMC